MTKAVRKNNEYYCPHCDEKVICRKPADYSQNDEIHACEFCGENIVWQPDWYLSDLRD